MISSQFFWSVDWASRWTHRASPQREWVRVVFMRSAQSPSMKHLKKNSIVPAGGSSGTCVTQTCSDEPPFMAMTVPSELLNTRGNIPSWITFISIRFTFSHLGVVFQSGTQLDLESSGIFCWRKEIWEKIKNTNKSVNNKNYWEVWRIKRTGPYDQALFRIPKTSISRKRMDLGENFKYIICSLYYSAHFLFQLFLSSSINLEKSITKV